MASRLNSDSSNGLQLISDSSGELQFQSSGVTKATLNSSGLSVSSTIDVQGNLKSDNAFFYAKRSGAQTGYNAVSQGDVVVVFNAAVSNIGNYYNTSTGKFTAPVDGIYMFWGSAYSATMTFSQCWLVINGSRGGGNQGTDCVNQASNFTVGHFLIQLSQGDTVGFHSYNGSVSNGTINDNYEHTYFRGSLLYEI